MSAKFPRGGGGGGGANPFSAIRLVYIVVKFCESTPSHCNSQTAFYGPLFEGRNFYHLSVPRTVRRLFICFLQMGMGIVILRTEFLSDSRSSDSFLYAD